MKKGIILLLFMLMLSPMRVQAREVNIIIPSEIETEQEVFYTTSRVNLRTEPSVESDSLGIIEFGEIITGAPIGDWIYCESLGGFVSAKYCVHKLKGKAYDIESEGFKSFMSHKSLSPASNQGQVQKLAGTDDKGFRRIYDRYCIAIGEHFNARVGQYVDLELENGTRIKAVVSDIKAEKDTQNNDRIHSMNGCVSEFVVDSVNLIDSVKSSGDVSKAYKKWNSPVIRIIVYNKYIL